MIRILIADDHKLIRETWAYMLDADAEARFQVIASCENSEDAVELSEKQHPDVILMDINMVPFSGMEATRKIREVSPESRVIGVSMHSQPSYARKMLQNGARGYVTKNSSKEEMMEAIMEVYRGNRYVCQEIKEILSDTSGQADPEFDPGQGIQSLTEREMNIINLIKAGYLSKEISDELGISLKTVEVHRHNILKKLKLRNSAALVNFMNTRSLFG
ncbi:MAG TPA: response regulator transcription factor [Puia sp.]|nr:response regulator transcription factor [Puia sp.]